ncbi:HpcH/HpaI aldolase/citrate lyase family protein [Streptomyces sp. S465]|uniref:HpcH/HpaI aldolase/citrate lyase family protein n=1 Tax=Streptomyces sp. S465 TaxID=2979468 RepID=UPI0022A8A774|nr:CoA ester lyase [Streptomyces sp. S465]WAP60287.1 CoA ester lyase [Streptomyces sp. S465]
MNTLRHARSFLFVPGNRPDRFARALSSGADATIIDLEDAVPASDKDTARDEVAAWLRTQAVLDSVVVRVNAVGTPWFAGDLRLVAEAHCHVMLPKSETPEDIAAAASRLAPDRAVVPLIETAAGVLAADRICAAANVARPALGNIDLANDLGVSPTDPAALSHARQHLVLAAAAARTAGPIDGVTPQFDDPDQVHADAVHAKSLGYTAKLCIHPRQIPPILRAFTPDEREVAWARQVLAAAAHDGGATALNGEMLDRPVYERAQAILHAVRDTRGEATDE